MYINASDSRNKLWLMSISSDKTEVHAPVYILHTCMSNNFMSHKRIERLKKSCHSPTNLKTFENCPNEVIFPPSLLKAAL